MNEQSPKYYEFGPFRVDGLRRTLLREETSIPLQPKVFETLLALVRNSGRLITKQVLIQQIWPDSFVEESNLAQNIFMLRKALGEDKHEHRYIVTIPGQGYQFVAQVRESPPEDELLRFADSQPGAGAKAVASVAVLPFKPLSNEEGDIFLGVGLADALITKLSNLAGIVVRPTTAVIRYNGSKQDPLVMGRELNVESVLDGIYQRHGKQLRVSAQLIRVSDGATLWAAKFDEKFTNLFGVQDSISEQVARALAPELSGEEQRRLRKSYTDNTDAFQLYVKGRYFWNRRTVEGLKKGIEFAQQALSIDPTYAMAYVGMADCYNLLAGHGGLAPRDTFPKAKAAALHALEIDAHLAEAHASLAFVHYRFDWDWEMAEANFRRAIELKPHYPTAHHWYGECLAALGRFEESISELKQALELDPLSLPINTDLAQSLFFAGRYEECDEQISKTLEMEPNFVRALIFHGMVNERKRERRQEAIASLEKAVDLSGGNILALAHLGHAYAMAGRTDEARRVLATLKRLLKERYVSAHNIALVHEGLKENEQALEWLKRAIHDRDVWLVWLKVAPTASALKSDPRFYELIRAIGLTT